MASFMAWSPLACASSRSNAAGANAARSILRIAFSNASPDGGQRGPSEVARTMLMAQSMSVNTNDGKRYLSWLSPRDRQGTFGSTGRAACAVASRVLAFFLPRGAGIAAAADVNIVAVGVWFV